MIKRQLGISMTPALGFGTYLLQGANCIKAISSAIEIGYRHIDTAQIYENEAEVGDALNDSGIKRSELFVTTKVWRSELTAQRILDSTKLSLEKLKTDYVDLLLIHWPTPEMNLQLCLDRLSSLKEDGLTKNVGVSNFTEKMISSCLMSHPGLISNHQFEYHPFLNQDKMIKSCKEAGITMTAYSPLAEGRAKDDATLSKIGITHNKSASQVALRWLMQQESMMAIPKASQPQNIRDNFEIFDFVLSSSEMVEIEKLSGASRFVNPHWAPKWDEIA
jgi:2,5-diketo-D-gluconate reductase B